MKLQVLQVLDCPNAAVLTARLEEVLAGRRDVRVEHRVIRDAGEAAAQGMTGSPTLLVDGVDPFQAAGLSPGISCRLYRDEAGTMSGAPSLAALCTALNSGPEPADADG